MDGGMSFNSLFFVKKKGKQELEFLHLIFPDWASNLLLGENGF